MVSYVFQLKLKHFNPHPHTGTRIRARSLPVRGRHFSYLPPETFALKYRGMERLNFSMRQVDPLLD